MPSIIKGTSAVFLISVGLIGTFLGFLLSATGIGAICGLPMIVVCFVIMLWGFILQNQAKKEHAAQQIQAGVQQVLNQANPQSQMYRQCSKCGANNWANSAVCQTCQASLVPGA